jgi:exopolyphosphatase/guanosine-5'-triphosphate,3'-diphosphate pyrophosphatase
MFGPDETLHVGVVDVGSNSVRFVVFDGAARSPAYFYNEKVMCALGAGLSQTGRLNPRGRERALDALCRFAALGRGMGLQSTMAVATAAVREAEDGPDFVAEVARRTGMRLDVIPGDEEARLSAQGVMLGWPGSYGLVCDIGLRRFPGISQRWWTACTPTWAARRGCGSSLWAGLGGRSPGWTWSGGNGR